MNSRLQSSGCLSTADCEFFAERDGRKPRWFARLVGGDRFLDIGFQPANRRLNCAVDLAPGTTVEIGCGRYLGIGDRHRIVREVVTTTAF